MIIAEEQRTTTCFSFSVGKSSFDAHPKQYEVASFDAFEEAILKLPRPRSKGGTYIAAGFGPNGNGLPHRSAESVLPSAYLAVDLDTLTPEQVGEAREFLGRWRSFGYTTFSHKPDAPRERHILALSRPASRSELLRIGRWLALQLRAYDIVPDAAQFRPEQPAYAPTADAETWHVDGDPLDVDLVLSEVKEEAAAVSSSPWVGELHPILEAFKRLNSLRSEHPFKPGHWAVQCPNRDTHAPPDDPVRTAIAVFEDGTWSFKCLHKNCLDIKSEHIFDLIQDYQAAKNSAIADIVIPSFQGAAAAVPVTHRVDKGKQIAAPQRERIKTEEEVDQERLVLIGAGDETVAINYPSLPGALGRLEKYFLRFAIYPNAQVAQAGVLSFAAGILGRHFNISGTGLNLYVLLIGRTGINKEAATDAGDYLLKEVRKQVPAAAAFSGPGQLPSGQGLLRKLGGQQMPCFYSTVGEFGLKLSAMCSTRATSAEGALHGALLDLYSKSGEGRVLRGSAYSDTERNVEDVEAPAFTLLGTTTPRTFVNAIGPEQLETGLVPRFLFVYASGHLPEINKHRHIAPPAELLEEVVRWCARSLELFQRELYYPVETSNAAEEVLGKHEEQMREILNRPGAEDDALAQLHNRAHLNVLRLAGLAAVADNPDRPEVTKEHAEWAVKYVESCLNAALYFLRPGGKAEQMGSSDRAQRQALAKLISRIMSGKMKERHKADAPLRKAGMVRREFLCTTALQLAPFGKALRGAAQAVKSTLDEFERNGTLALAENYLKEPFGIVKSAVYIVNFDELASLLRGLE